jgi:hypothetical protein
MSRPTDPSRDLLFALLALQNGLIDKGPLFAAFGARTRDKGRSLADHLVEFGHLDSRRRAAVDAIAGVHVQALGGDIEKSLAVLAVDRSTRESLARAGGPDVEATLEIVRLAQSSTQGNEDPDRSDSYSWRDAGGRLGPGQGPGLFRPWLGRANAHSEILLRLFGHSAGLGAGHAGFYEPRAGTRGSRPPRSPIGRL